MGIIEKYANIVKRSGENLERIERYQHLSLKQKNAESFIYPLISSDKEYKIKNKKDNCC